MLKIWRNRSGAQRGVAQSQARPLEKYHGLEETTGRSFATTGITALIHKVDVQTDQPTAFGRLREAVTGPVKRLLERPLNRIFAKTPWVAGETADSAVARALELKEKGCDAILCCLGEHIATRESVKQMVAEYHDLIDLMATKGIRATIAVRPSPFGSDIPDADRHEFCWENLDAITRHAKEKGVFVWVDMESLEYTNYTLQLYKDLQKTYGNVGLAIQANVKRSEEDLRGLIQAPELVENLPVVRLVKGIYTEDAAFSYEDYGQIHQNFKRLIRVIFNESKPGTRVVVGTHHEARILDALRLFGQHTGQKTLELQVLKGIKSHLKDDLLAVGYRVTEYVPYGSQAFAYSARRMAKSPDFANSVMMQEIGGWPKPVRAVVGKALPIAYRLFTGHQLNTTSAQNSQNDVEELKTYLQSKKNGEGA